MSIFCSIFSQLLQLFPRMEFQRIVKKHNAERSAKGFTCWGQFVSMLFCRVGRAHSLREIVSRVVHSLLNFTLTEPDCTFWVDC